MKHSIWVGVILCALASISWGAMFPVAESAFEYVNPFYFTLIRYIPVTVLLCILLFTIEGKSAFKTNGKGFFIWFFGMMGFTIYNLFIFWGQDLLGADGVLLASIMEALAPILSILFVWYMFKEKPYKFTVFTIAGAFIGVFMVVTNGDMLLLFRSGKLVPLIILLLAASGWALYTIGGTVFKDWSVLRYSALSCLYGTVTSLIIVLIFSFTGHIEVPGLKSVIAIKYHMLFMIVFPGILALLFWNKGVYYLKPINAILFINLAPVTTLLSVLYKDILSPSMKLAESQSYVQ